MIPNIRDLIKNTRSKQLNTSWYMQKGGFNSSNVCTSSSIMSQDIYKSRNQNYQLICMFKDLFQANFQSFIKFMPVVNECYVIPIVGI